MKKVLESYTHTLTYFELLTLNLRKSPALAIHRLFAIYAFPTDGHDPFTRCLLLLTHPHSSIRPSIFFTCLSSSHIFTYTRPHIYPNNLPNPNITSLTSSFTSSQLLACHSSTTSSTISFNRRHRSPFSFLKHPQYFIPLLLSSSLPHTIHNAIRFNFSISLWPQKKRSYPASAAACSWVLISGGGSSSTVSRVGLFLVSSCSLALLRRSPCFRTGRFSSSGLPPLGSVLGVGAVVLRAAFSGRCWGKGGVGVS